MIATIIAIFILLSHIPPSFHKRYFIIKTTCEGNYITFELTFTFLSAYVNIIMV